MKLPGSQELSDLRVQRHLNVLEQNPKCIRPPSQQGAGCRGEEPGEVGGCAERKFQVPPTYPLQGRLMGKALKGAYRFGVEPPLPTRASPGIEGGKTVTAFSKREAPPSP